MIEPKTSVPKNGVSRSKRLLKPQPLPHQHWGSYDRLNALGAVATNQRVIQVGKVITAAGVSSGIDMGLVLVQQLAGEETAKAIQLAIEYDPQPPFDSGSISKASPELIALVSKIFS